MKTFRRSPCAAFAVASGCLLLHAAHAADGAWAQDALHTAGPQSGHILDLWRIALVVCTLVFSAVLVAFLWALWRTPRADENAPADDDAPRRPERGPILTVAWATAASTVLLLGLVVLSIATDRALARLSLDGALHIEVTAHQWWWEARYDDADPARIFTTANELHVPVGRPVIVSLQSADVIHSLWVPNLAGKKDLIPGRSATMQFRADKAGSYRGQCAEFCGLQHAWMAFVVTADPPEAYERWAGAQRQSAAAPRDAQTLRGQQVFLGSTCAMCHAIQGTSAGGTQAPDLTHVGSRLTLAAGALPNTREAMAAWIADPASRKPGANMPPHRFSPEDMQALVAYLESLR